MKVSMKTDFENENEKELSENYTIKSECLLFLSLTFNYNYIQVQILHIMMAYSSSSSSSSTSTTTTTKYPFNGFKGFNYFKVYQQNDTYRRQFYYTENEAYETEPIFFIDLDDDTSGLFSRAGIYWVETDITRVSKEKFVGNISSSLVKDALDTLLFTTLKWSLSPDVSSRYLTTPMKILESYNKLVDDDDRDDTSFFDMFNLNSYREMMKLWIRFQ